MKHIYPMVLYTRTRIETIVRKKHTDGRWYLCSVFEWISPNGSTEDYDCAIERFNFAVYLFLIAGKINPDIQDELGQPVFPLDEDQRNEEDRLQVLIEFKEL